MSDGDRRDPIEIIPLHPKAIMRRPTAGEVVMDLFDRYGWTLLIILPALCALAAWWLS